MHPYRVLESILILAVSALLCDYGSYYYVSLFSCSGWSDKHEDVSNRSSRFMLIADVHIMGHVKSYWIDKTIREWQMKQAFKILNKAYKPDVVVFLGDLFDEGSFSSNERFQIYSEQFQQIFPLDPEQKLIVIPGNHDVGYHHTMIRFPFLLYRFSNLYNSTESINQVDPRLVNNHNVLVSNSMSFYNDSCDYCSVAILDANAISSKLKTQRLKEQADFSEPVLFHHIPLYRTDDLNCDLSNKLNSKNNEEGHDVLHRAVSEFILRKLEPRLVISGHSHMFCLTNHTVDQRTYKEVTITSFNYKYAETKPGFALLSLSTHNHSIQHCYLIDEWILVSIYTLAVIVVSVRLLTGR